MKAIPLLLAMAITALGCRHASNVPLETNTELKPEASEILEVIPTPNLSKTDAEKVINFYIINNIGGCGGIYELTDNGTAWLAKVAVGIAGAIDPEPIRLEKASGSIAWHAGPSFESIHEMVQVALTRRSTRTPPALPSALSQHSASSAPLVASVQAGPVSFIR